MSNNTDSPPDAPSGLAEGHPANMMGSQPGAAPGSQPEQCDPEPAHRLAGVRDSVDDAVDHIKEAIKPLLRGWLHLGLFPVALAAGIVLVSVAPDAKARWACATYALSVVLLFGISALYHRGHWTPRTTAILRRFDHANIFLIIAGTYTPFAVLLLSPERARTLLWVVWGGALVGTLLHLFWVNAPRWVYTPIYVALGWVAIFYLKPFLHAGGVAVVTLLIIGGVLYTIGGAIYAAKRPNPSPKFFGFHEVFHAFTLAAFIVHYIAVSLVAYRH